MIRGALQRYISATGQVGPVASKITDIHSCLCSKLISLTELCQTRSLQTSTVAMRRLDSRLYPPSKEPSKRTGRWVPLKKMSEMYEYTVEPRPFPRTGGRGPNGRIWTHRIGGGFKREFRMIDWVRGGSSEQPLVEKVDHVMVDACRSAHIAMVVSGERKRWILATQNMQKGDRINSSTKMTKMAVRANEGDSHPLGSLPIGTLVNCVEAFPGDGGLFARAAGVTAQLVRKTDKHCVVRLPSKREIQVDSTCTATVGRVSNINHNKRILGKAGASRWLGIRPKSGLWHRKGGRFGRKIRPIKPMKVYDKRLPPKPEIVKYFTPGV